MTLKDALRNCLTVKYCSVQGRASRSEYWWFMLFSSVATAVLENIPVVGILASLAFIVPTVCVTSRRLHDIGWSGWWQLLPLILFLVSVASILFDVSGMTFVVLFLCGLGFALYLGIRKGTGPGEANPYGGAPDSFDAPARPVNPAPTQVGDFTLEEESPVQPCPNCGKPFAPDAKFCGHCGHAWPVAPKCPSCGRELKDDSRFCTQCGAKLKD